MWLPEAGGPVDWTTRGTRVLMQVLAAQSQREVVRSRHRTLAAMTVQAVEQGRYLGGRPPYGYRLVDAGPHPNRAHARGGRRLRRLDPDPVTAPHVRWMFAQRLAGRSVASIARELNERGVPCPSAADPDRNRHRSGRGGPCARSRRSWPTRATPAVRCGTDRPASRGERGAVDGRGRRGRCPGPCASCAGERGGLRCRAAVSGRAAEQGRRDARVCARRAVAVRVVRAAAGRALGPRPGRIPMPSRSPAAPGRDRWTRAQHLRARGCDPGSAREATCVRSAPARRRRRAEDRRRSRRLVAVRVEGDRLRQGRLDARPGRANASLRVDDQTGPDRCPVLPEPERC